MINKKNKFMVNIKFAIRLIVSIGLYYTGLLNVIKYLRRKFSKENGINILAYHDISNKEYLGLHVPPEIFESHIDYLISCNYNLISLLEAVRILKDNEPIPPDTIVITFDDVYKSFYNTVFPIIKRHNVPITIFICTDPLEKRFPLFIDALIYAVDKTVKNELDLTSIGLGKYLISSHDMKEEAILRINEYSKNLDMEKRHELLELVFKQLDVDMFADELRAIVLTWEEIINMSNNSKVEFGSHTVNHPSLSRISLDDARNEMSVSKSLIQQKLNKEIKSFAYPFGSFRDINKDVEHVVEESGYLCACSLNGGINKNETNMYLLNRICVTNSLISKVLWRFSKAFYAVQLTGFDKAIKFWNRPVSAGPDQKKIRILYLIDQLETGAGTERHLLNLVTNLDKNRFECFVYYFEGREGKIQKEIRGNGIVVKKMDLSKIYSPKAFVKSVELAKVIKKNKIDIVQAFHFKSDTLGVLVSKLAGVLKIVSSRRDTGDLKKPRQIKLNKIMNRFIDHYITVCDAVAHKVNEYEGVSSDVMTTIYNGVNLNKFRLNGNNVSYEVRERIEKKEGDFIIGTTALFRPEKAFHILFEGIEKTLPFIKGIKVLVLGDGPLRRQLEDYCSNGELRNIVKFIGYVDNVQDYVKQMDIFCLVPNSNEGFSNAILEAMSLGRPVIASAIGGNAEAVVHDKTGIIIPPDDSESLKKALIMLYNNPELRMKMGREARQRIEDKFTLEEMVTQHANYYERILQKQMY